MTDFDVISEEAQRAGITVQQLRGPRTYKHYAEARRRAAHRLHEMGRSYASIGRALGGRHHTTILAYFWTAADRREKSVEMHLAALRKEETEQAA